MTKLAVAATVLAVLGTAAVVAAMAIWFVSLILPAVIVAAGVAWAAWKYRAWRLRRSPAPFPLRRF